MTIKMSSLCDSFTGRPAAVLGGGPSLPADMQKLPPDCILIAVNYHAFHICEPKYIVYNDHPQHDPRLAEFVFEPKAIRVSPEPTSDVIFDVDVWTGFYSANAAAWFALWMGCEPVILCGMDLYQGDKLYCHPYDGPDVPCFHYPLEHHIRPWIEEGRNLLPHVERLRAMSGPLVNVFGQFRNGSGSISADGNAA